MNSSFVAVPTGAGMSSSAARDSGTASSAVASVAVSFSIARARVLEARDTAARRRGTRARAAAAATGAAEADIAKEDIVATGPSTGTRVRCSGEDGIRDDRSVAHGKDLRNWSLRSEASESRQTVLKNTHTHSLKSRPSHIAESSP